MADGLMAEFTGMKLGPYLLRQAIDTIDGRKVAGRRVHVSTIKGLAQIESCHILLIAAQQREYFIQEARPGLDQALLTIVDMTGESTPPPTGDGILITLLRNDARIGFEVNLAQARRSGLRMSSKLLKLARIAGN